MIEIEILPIATTIAITKLLMSMVPTGAEEPLVEPAVRTCV
jgi:hypothetical protein